MGPKLEGIWKCKVLNASSGANDKGLMEVLINVEIIEGKDEGRRCTYSEVIDGKSAQYAAQSMKAVGWDGKTLRSLKADADAWVAATGGTSTVEIKHLEVKSGKRAGTIWDKVNSIGRRPRELKAIEATNEMLVDADAALTAAINAGEYGGFGDTTPPPIDHPPDVPPQQDNIPF